MYLFAFNLLSKKALHVGLNYVTPSWQVLRRDINPQIQNNITSIAIQHFITYVTVII